MALVLLDLKSFLASTWIHIGHFPHFFIPIIVLWFLFCLSGSFALQSIDLRLGGCLKANMGGLGKISNIFLSLVMVLQCFNRMFEMLGNAGLYVTTNITLSFSFFFTLNSAVSLGIPLAFWIAAFTMFLL